MNRRDSILAILAFGTLALPIRAQQARVFRIGALGIGGAAFTSVDGLRSGLHDLGLEEGKQYLLHLRDANGNNKAIETEAKRLEAERVDLIFTVSTSVTLAAKRATNNVPIVFYAGSDPVKAGLVASYRQPGGRLTGIHSLTADLMAKRLQILKEMIPRLQRVAVYYNPENPASERSMITVRESIQRLKLALVQRPVTSVEQLRTALGALRPVDADAILSVPDAMVSSQSDLMIRVAKEKKLPTMFQFSDAVAKGALASYGVSYFDLGRLSAKHVQRILAGAGPGDLPVEQIDRFSFMINRKTAKELGITIPQSVLLRADKVFE